MVAGTDLKVQVADNSNLEFVDHVLISWRAHRAKKFLILQKEDITKFSLQLTTIEQALSVGCAAFCFHFLA